MEEDKTADISGIARFSISTQGASYQGIIDEFRISSEVRTGGWIKLSYENQKQGSTVASME